MIRVQDERKPRVGWLSHRSPVLSEGDAAASWPRK
jgi:hypothetical protein